MIVRSRHLRAHAVSHIGIITSPSVPSLIATIQLPKILISP
ncbi:hypothetical protein RSAG8_11108, partial [Rhizoctonia solani AG-8 WAC10335]